MVIIHKIGDFLYNLFPKAKDSVDSLKEELTDYYTFGPFRPKIDIEDDFVKIEIDTSAISSQKTDFDIVVKHCEKRNFKKAKPILEKLIKKNPTVSEYHRILGQIYSEEGNQNEAVNCLIDALRWDSRNTHALTLMGNIFARFHNDVETAMTYYEQTLSVHPDDHIAMNNIGANLLQLGRVREAEKYLLAAFNINDSYPNTIYALGMIEDLKGNQQKAFEYAIHALKTCNPGHPVYSNALEMAQQAGLKAVQRIDSAEMYNQYSQQLAIESGKNIDIIQDDTIPTPAKFEMAENYNRDKHVIRFKKDRLAVAHLMMHELVHLDFSIQCRKQNANFLFVATKEQKELFIRENEPIIQRLNREGLDDKSIANYITTLFNGINSQSYNTPVDLFIEDFLYKTYSQLRPFQFLSLLSLLKEYIDAATNKKILEYTPAKIRTANIILSLVHSFQFRDLFGYDTSHLFKATSPQIKLAKEFYAEYLKSLRNDKSLDAHLLILKWAKELRVENYFSLIDENDYRRSKAPDENILQEPEHFIKAEAEPPPKNRIDYSEDPAGEAAVTMYCLSALQHFEGMELSEIQKVGFEIGLLGRQGIDSSNHDKKYTLKSIPDKEFTGLQLLVYMYAAFQVIDPFLDIGLNFKKEYDVAKSMHKKDADS
jgi:Tfp pilus assembly protein PilF